MWESVSRSDRRVGKHPYQHFAPWLHPGAEGYVYGGSSNCCMPVSLHGQLKYQQNPWRMLGILGYRGGLMEHILAHWSGPRALCAPEQQRQIPRVCFCDLRQQAAGRASYHPAEWKADGLWQDTGGEVCRPSSGKQVSDGRSPWSLYAMSCQTARQILLKQPAGQWKDWLWVRFSGDGVIK